MIRSLCFALAIILATQPAIEATAAPHPVKMTQYHVLMVNLFTVQNGVDFPLDYLATMQEELMVQVKKKNPIFTEVLRPGEKPTDPDAKIVYLDGIVTEFHPGSRTLRYVIGPGVGKTKIVAHVRLYDPSADKTFLEKFVDGKVIMGFIGGESIGATRGLAKEVAKDTHKLL
jgi:hypothetical protein